jgi:hypothetical protein
MAARRPCVTPATDSMMQGQVSNPPVRSALVRDDPEGGIGAVIVLIALLATNKFIPTQKFT